MSKEKTCLAMFSGGLDSMLAIILMEKLGFRVIPINFNIGVFFKKYIREDGKLTFKNKMPFKEEIRVVDISKDFLKMLKDPKHGYGKHMNPCIDCKITMLRKAKELMKEFDAGFVITGEVLGQRPMSQNAGALKEIHSESELGGYLVRPLCAKSIAPSEPEKLGWINRDDLLGINGRGRKKQIELAQQWGLEKFVESPAGGCLLTEEKYGMRLKDMFEHSKDKELEEKDMFLLSVGRQFRKGEIKFIVGRNQEDNEKIIQVMEGAVSFEAADAPGPVAISFDKLTEDDEKLIGSVVARYTKLSEDESVNIKVIQDGKEKIIAVKPAGVKDTAEMRIDR